MTKVILIKLSAPGWEKSFSDWPSALGELKEWICKDCFATYHFRYHQTLADEIKAGTSPEEAREIAREEAKWCIPDNFLDLDPEEQVGHLLDTRCGTEFMINEENISK